jgi:hypothetical protein
VWLRWIQPHALHLWRSEQIWAPKKL